MAWLNEGKSVIVQEELGGGNKIEESGAYEIEITSAYLSHSRQANSKSVSLCIEGVFAEEGKEDKTIMEFFTIMGKDGKAFYTRNYGRGAKNFQHIGLRIVNSAFKILLDKTIFDIEPQPMTYEKWDNELKERVSEKGDGFPDLIGKKIGICVQMIREIKGQKSKELSDLVHFFDYGTGLFADEVNSDHKKIDKWLRLKKDFIVKEVEEYEAPQSSFGQADDESGEKKPSPWGN